MNALNKISNLAGKYFALIIISFFSHRFYGSKLVHSI